MIEIRFEEQELRRLDQFLKEMPRAVPRILRSSINRTTTALRRDILRMTTKEYRLQQKNIQSRVRLGARAEIRRLNRRITLKSRRIGLINFGARQNAKGVSAGIRRGGGRKLHRSAFIATGLSNNRHVFMRKGAKRLPIQTLYGPSMVDIWKETLETTLRPQASQTLTRVTREAIDREVVKRLRGRG